MTPRFHKETSRLPFTATFLQTVFKLTELCFTDDDWNVSASTAADCGSFCLIREVWNVLFTAGPGNQITSVKVMLRVKTLQLLCGLALLPPSLFDHLEPKCLEAAQDRYPHDTRWRTAVTSSSAGFCFLFWDLKPGGRKPVQKQWLLRPALTEPGPETCSWDPSRAHETQPNITNMSDSRNLSQVIDYIQLNWVKM